MASLVKNMAGQTIVCDSITELSKMHRVYPPTTSGVQPIAMLKCNREPWKKQRQEENVKGVLNKKEWLYFTDNYLSQLPAWHSIYLKQSYEYNLVDTEMFSTYSTCYKALIEMLEKLKASKGVNEEWNIIGYSWGKVWSEYYDICTLLDTAIYNRKNASTIVSAIIFYAVNNTTQTPPAWQTKEERERAGWTSTLPTVSSNEVIWGSVEYKYAPDESGVEAYSYGIPYVVSGKGTPTDKGLTLVITPSYQLWSARGVKLNKDITARVSYKEEIPRNNWVIKSGYGVSIEDTQEANVKRITTEQYPDDMSDIVVIEVSVNDGTEIKKAEATLEKRITGKAEATYIGMRNVFPEYYEHDGIADSLFVGDWFLSTEEDTTTPLRYGVVYELIDINNKHNINGWREIDGTGEKDADKLSACIKDMEKLDPAKTEGTEIKGHTWFLKGLTTQWIIDKGDLSVKGTSNLEGDVVIGGKKIIDIIYPIGSIYITTSELNPGDSLSILGSSGWELVGKNATLWGAGYEYEVKNEDGTVETRTMEAGVNIEAGLPNITGKITGFRADSGTQTAGAFYQSEKRRGTYYQNNTVNTTDVLLDASRSSAVYGKSDTVQPPALTVYMWKRIS